MATADSYKSLMYGFRVASNTIYLFVPEVCEAIYQIYKNEELKCPSTTHEWREISQQFGQRWKLQHALRALDGQQPAMECPRWSRFRYYNYKGFYSVDLLALVNANYRFLWAVVGSNGCCSDAQIFNDCQLKQSVMDGTIAFFMLNHCQVMTQTCLTL